jgi:UDP-glucose 4-epimerase
LKKCLVIGGAGLIGSSVSRLLVETGRDVIILDRNPKPERELPHEATYVTGDYNDRPCLRELLTETSEVIDLAYSTVPKTSFDDPLFDIRSNLPSGVTLFQEAARVDLIKMVIVSSGGTVYGKANSLPIDEIHPTNPISPYGITKLAIEKYAGMYALTNGLPVLIARPSNAYGEEQVAFSGQGFIATAIESIIQRKRIDIYGKQGTIRDYLHTLDIARGLLAVLEHGISGDVYNIGSGIGRNNIDVLETIRPLALPAGYKIELNILPERSFDVPANILNSQKLISISGWHPQIPFTEGIERVWNAFLKHYATRASKK